MIIENLNLTHLRYFLDTVEAMSFSTAAKKNHVSRPAISQGIKKLEEFVGIQLFVHQKNNLKLTKKGEDFFRQSKKSFEYFKKQFMGNLAEENSIRLGCSLSLTEKILIPSLNIFDEIPQLEIKVGTSSHLKYLLENGMINVAIYIGDPLIDNTFVNHTIIKGEFTLLSKNGKLGNTLIVTEDRPEVVDLKIYLRKKGIKLRYLKVESWSLAIKLAESLNVSCFVPNIMAENTKLKKFRLNLFQTNYEVILTQKRNEYLSVAEAKFCKHLSKK